MKSRIILTLLGCFIASATFALPGTLIRGTWERRGDGVVKLYSVDHGRLEEISSYRTGKDKRFSFFFEPPYEGLFVIGTGSAQAHQDKYSFYFKGGDALNLAVNDSSYTLTGPNSKENQELTRWHELLVPLEIKTLGLTSMSTYVDFFPDLQAVNARADLFKAIKTNNRQFDGSFGALRDFDIRKLGVGYLMTPRTKHPKIEEYPDFYRHLDVARFTSNASVLHYPFGYRILDNMLWVERNMKGNNDMKIESRLPALGNDTLKGELVLQQAAGLKTYLGYEDLKANYGKYILTPDQKSRAEEFRVKLAKESAKAGKPAINFSYPDASGKVVSLSDFKGKVVLVDVWATWCGPCKAEIPALKKLEEEMHDREVVFMSVSVDVEKDHQKWKDFIDKENLKGVQLFASGWSDIAKFYDIKGIPRFMVFDKQGNIVTIDAPRPSGTELKLLLESKL